MLTVGKVLPGNADYYQSAVVAGVEDYYAGDGDAPGVWVGRADMVGAVAGSLATAVDSKLLLEAKCAPDGTRLGKTTVSERSVTAFDLTFSAPKSVSLLHALGGPVVAAAVDAAQTAAVEQAIASISSRIGYTRTGHAGTSVVDAEGVFGVRYRHRTSRALDPQLHDHVLVSNAVRTVSDGVWRTLDARGLYRNAKAAGVEFQTFLRSELTARLGVEFEEVDANGQADIVGIDRELLEEFSTRGVDIEAALGEWTAGFLKREGRNPTPAEFGKAHKTITLATRPAKPDEAGLATATLRAGWRARADWVVDVDRVLDRVLAHPVSPGVIVRPSVEVVLEAVETRHGEWSEAQLIEQIAMRTTGPDARTIADTIESVRADAMGSAGVVDLCPEAGPGEVVRASDGRSVALAPSAVRYTTSGHLQREIDLVEWATRPAMAGHQRREPKGDALAGLDASQAEAVTAMLGTTRPVVAVVGPAGAGKTRMLAAAVDSWRQAGVEVFGVGPSASSAQQLADGAGTSADTLHKLVHEHHTKWIERRESPDRRWWLPAGSVVIIDEAGMVDTRLLHTYAQMAQRKNWRTVLVGDHRQLDSVDAGGMFAEFVEHTDVLTVELDTLHRFEHQWEADTSLLLRDGKNSAVDAYEGHDRVHGYADEHTAIDAVIDAAFVGNVGGRDVLVMAPTNRVVEQINEAMTERLLAADQLDPVDAIDIGGCRFFVGQPVATRANDRRLTHGPDEREWVRNGDRWTVLAGTSDELYLRHREMGDHQALPAEYVEAGHLSVDYASTINRAQGATVDEAHVIVDERTNSKQLYVAMTRGRDANHVHAAPPAVDLEQHGPTDTAEQWTPTDAVTRALRRHPDQLSALGRRRQLREDAHERSEQHDSPAVAQPPDHAAAAAMRRLQHPSRRPSQGLGR
ncbi:MAG: MobF family relaxase [Ilumatobacter sp.]|uniref:MobF family relaxase n=1 Tax=Ilumatobacter sp. TaxID=1967498 RepID=UPI00391B1FD4